MNTVPPTTATGRLQRFLVNPSQTTIGFQFLGLGLLTGCVGSALALIIRFQLAWPDEQVIRPETYLAFVTLHGTLMLFFTISPIIVSGFGTLLIPAMIGARALESVATKPWQFMQVWVGGTAAAAPSSTELWQ